jgi:hypothetical protein
MIMKDKRVWVTPEIKVLSVKGMTLSGYDAAPNEAGGQVSYHPYNKPPTNNS